MIAFDTTTAFRIVRQLSLGQGSTGMYLLICDEGAQLAIEADLKAEVEVQMGSPPETVQAQEPLKVNDVLGLPEPGYIRVVRIDRWSPELVALLDTHVILLERTGAQFLFLATMPLAEQLLANAPNFRNRLTELFRIFPDAPFGGSPHEVGG